MFKPKRSTNCRWWQGGTNLLLASYDASTTASLTPPTKYQRPADANPTSEAQLAIAEAAFMLAVATRDANTRRFDTNATVFGSNLVVRVLDKFRPPKPVRDRPRGITERPYLTKKRHFGKTLWPEAEQY